MNRLEKTAARLKYAARLRDDSKIVTVVRPAYNLFLNMVYGRRGVCRTFGDEEPIRLHPAHRYFRDDYESSLCRYLRTIVQAGDVIFEVGANVGVFTVLLARWVGPEGRVYAFEPSPVAREALRQHLAWNQVTDRVTVSPLAISDIPGRGILYEDNASGLNTLSTVHRLLPNAKPVEIEMATIDSFCRENGVVPRLIKIDIEGYEFHALRGASGVLVAHKPTVVMELHPMLWPEIGISGAQAKCSLEVSQYCIHPLSGQISPVTDYGHVALVPGIPFIVAGAAD
jgi:FkbM family methyltransferase